MGWFWSKVDEEKQQRVDRKCKMFLTAHQNCKGAYAGKNDSSSFSRKNGDGPCDALRNQVLHCYSKNYCPEVASDYEKCFHLAVSRGRYLAHRKTGEKPCEKHVKNMKKCMKRAKTLPKGVL